MDCLSLQNSGNLCNIDFTKRFPVLPASVGEMIPTVAFTTISIKNRDG